MTSGGKVIENQKNDKYVKSKPKARKIMTSKWKVMKKQQK